MIIRKLFTLRIRVSALRWTVRVRALVRRPSACPRRALSDSMIKLATIVTRLRRCICIRTLGRRHGRRSPSSGHAFVITGRFIYSISFPSTSSLPTPLTLVTSHAHRVRGELARESDWPMLHETTFTRWVAIRHWPPVWPHRFYVNLFLSRSKRQRFVAVIRRSVTSDVAGRLT